MRYLFIALCSITVLLLGVVMLLNIGSDREPSSNNALATHQKVRVAVCPTYMDLTHILDKAQYHIIPTSSTSESIDLIKNDAADLILSGRTLKPSEPQLNSTTIANGLSFLSMTTLTITAEDLSDHSLYTDIPADLLDQYLPRVTAEYVDNVYDHIDKGIIITSWDNTDHTKAAIVHLLDKYGNRLQSSRQLTIYAKQEFIDQSNELASLLINNYYQKL